MMQAKSYAMHVVGVDCLLPISFARTRHRATANVSNQDFTTSFMAHIAPSQ